VVGVDLPQVVAMVLKWDLPMELYVMVMHGSMGNPTLALNASIFLVAKIVLPLNPIAFGVKRLENATNGESSLDAQQLQLALAMFTTTAVIV